MYSRSSPRPSYEGGLQRGPSYQSSIRIPPNYSGMALGASPPDGVPPTGDGVTLRETSDEDRGLATPEAYSEEGAETSTTDETVGAEAGEPSEKAVSPVSSPLAGLFSGGHFPFGHGLGYEELLLLGLLLFLLKEGEGQSRDDDLYVTVALLGALLFCG